MDGDDHAPKPTLCSLPNEVFYCILDNLWVNEMLVLSSVCRQFSALVTRTVHRRLHAMEALEKFQVGIIYYQPQQSVRSPVLCDYFGKEDVGDTCADKDPNVASSSCRLLTGYSRFCPEGTGNGSRHANARSEDDDPVRHSDAVRQRLFLNWIITLDDFEPFAQLCVGAHLFWKNDQMRKGSQAHIDNGTLSFWREWLDGRLEPHEPHEAHEPEDPGTETNSTGRGMGHPIDFRPGRRQVLWVGSHGHVGLKLSVTGRHRHIDPRDFSSYQVEFEELLIRNTQLLLALEHTQQLGGSPENRYSTPIITDANGMPTMPIR